MRKSLLLPILIMTLILTGIFTSCKEDEPKDLIVGTWLKEDGTTSTFNEGGTCVINGATGTWSIAGTSLTLNFTYSQPIIFNIVTISETSMVLVYPNEPTIKISYTKQ